MIRQADPEIVSRSRALISCTAPLSQKNCLAAENKFGIPVLQSYGLTETLIVSLEQLGRRAETQFSAGMIAGGASSVRFTDNVLVIQNNAVSPGYVQRRGATLQFKFDKGKPGMVFKSGDLGRLDEGGRLHITGRETNVINIDGVKVSPEQIEEVLNGFKDIEEAVVLGVPDQRGTERPVAVIRSTGSPDLDNLADACARRLGAKARPATILVVDSIPTTENEKVDRSKIKELLARA